MPLLKNVVCPGCGCVCDDVTLEVKDNEILKFAPRCHLGEAWFRRGCSGSQVAGAHNCAVINGNLASVSEAIQRSAEILSQSGYPLIFGLSRSETSGQRAAVALADALGGAIDTTASLCHAPSIMALQETGEVTCTLGEVRNRADLVIFWGSNPAETHPRHAERYSVFPTGRFTANGRSDRKVVMVGDADTIADCRIDDNGTPPDLIVPISPGEDFEALTMLRSALHGDCLHPLPPQLQQLLDLMKSCRYGIVFFGLGLAKSRMWSCDRPSGTGHHDVAALLKLVADMNAVTRFTARRMRLQGDVSGADSVLGWQTGYPFGVDFSRGYPRYNPGEFTANDLLERSDIDACLMLGSEAVKFFSDQAQRHLRSIPTILIDYPDVPSDTSIDVRFTTAVHGIHTGGTVYRMDNVPLSLSRFADTDLPTDEFILSAIQKLCDSDMLHGS